LLKSAIEDYKKGKYKSAYESFKELTCKERENNTDAERIQRY
ncbi:27504_t:CDS:1, partial [Dentiscutata erythropus]